MSSNHLVRGSILFLVVTLFISVALLSCHNDNAVSPADAKSGLLSETHSLTTETVFITPDGNWTLTAFDPVYDPVGDSTTFSYQLVGPDKNMHFIIGYPLTSCTYEPTSYEPTDGNLNWSDFPIFPNIAWHPPVGSGGTNTFEFAYSFAGDIPSADVQTGVKVLGINYYEGYYIQGPGIPTYTVSGNVFQDANSNALLDAGETFIPGVTLNLTQDGSLVTSTVSDENGYYEFTEVLCGEYVVEIDTSTLTGTQSKYFVNTTPLTFNVSVGPDSPGNNFGFDVNTGKILLDLGDETLPTDGVTSSWWKKQYQFAASGRDAYFPRDTLIAFLDRLEGVALSTPFDFTGTDEERLQAAYNILKRPIKTEFDAFERELLAVEINYVAGFGIDPSTQLVLIGWGETLYNDNIPANPKFGMTAGLLSGATDVYSGIDRDKSPGGGGTR